MTRKYESIWEAVKAADVGSPVDIKVHGTALRTVKQAILKEKSRETAIKKRLGLRYAGKLEIVEITEGVKPHGYAILRVTLTFDGSRL